jgi:hypothetical protein
MKTIVLVVVGGLLAWYFLLRSSKKPVDMPAVVTGRRYKGYGLATQLGFPTINLKLTQTIPAGMFLADSDYGKVVMMSVGDECECHYLQWNDEIDKLKTLQFFNPEKIKEYPHSIVEAFNRGAELIAASIS